MLKAKIEKWENIGINKYILYNPCRDAFLFEIDWTWISRFICFIYHNFNFNMKNYWLEIEALVFTLVLVSIIKIFHRNFDFKDLSVILCFLLFAFSYNRLSCFRVVRDFKMVQKYLIILPPLIYICVCVCVCVCTIYLYMCVGMLVPPGQNPGFATVLIQLIPDICLI